MLTLWYRCAIGLFVLKKLLLKISQLVIEVKIFSKKHRERFGGFAESAYLCTRFRERTENKFNSESVVTRDFGSRNDVQKERTFSSAGSERLPYKQRVGGSNPSTSTNGDG